MRLRWQAFRTWVDLAYFSRDRGRRERRNLAIVAMKLLRSSLLVAKVLTIRRVCPDPLTRPRPLASAFLLALAICDTVLDHDDWNRREGEGGSHDKREKEGIRLLRRNAVVNAMSRVGSGIWITVALTLFHFTLVGLTSMPSMSKDGLRGFHELWSRACCIELADGW